MLYLRIIVDDISIIPVSLFDKMYFSVITCWNTWYFSIIVFMSKILNWFFRIFRIFGTESIPEFANQSWKIMQNLCFFQERNNKICLLEKKKMHKMCQLITEKSYKFCKLFAKVDHSLKKQNFSDNVKFFWVEDSCLQYSFGRDFKILVTKPVISLWNSSPVLIFFLFHTQGSPLIFLQ